MTEIVYCDGCGKRIREGDGRNAVEGKVFCSACGAKAVTSTAHHPLPADITARTGTSGRAESQARIAGSSRRSVATPSKGQKTNTPAESGPNKTVYIAGGAGMLVLLVVLFMLLGKGETPDSKKTVKAAQTPATPISNPDTQLTHAPATPPAQPSNPEPSAAKTAAAEDPGPSIEDIREGYARRKLDDAAAKEKAKSLTPEAYRAELQGLVASHGSTKAGKEAAEILKNLPPPAPKAEAKTTAASDGPKAADGPYKTLFRWSGDAGAGAAAWTRGSKDEKTVPAGKAFSWQSESTTIGWFTLISTISFRDQNVKLSKDSWIRIHYRLDGGKYLCFHSAIGDQLLEKHFAGLPEGKWGWLGFKVADFTRDIHTDAPPKDWSGANWIGSTIYGHTERKPGTLWIDEVVIGDGPLPANDGP
ncbi:MAG: hypothetical protein HY291_01320 [Planctomycetes bacterium]|nr:hypothetical protein [Planctomycetota bacterium]